MLNKILINFKLQKIIEGNIFENEKLNAIFEYR